MTQRDQDLMDQYLYQVVRRLPKDQREEVRLELQELIGDMFDRSESMEAVLTELGDPARFARNYRDDAHYLIGPEYYDTYLWFIKIVLLCTIIPVLAVSIIEGLRDGLAGVETNYIGEIVRAIVTGITNAVIDGIESCILAFGGVTLAFAIMERLKIRIDLKHEKKWMVDDLDKNPSAERKGWTPEFLSPIPDKKAVISRGDSIAGIIFIVIFCVLLITVPQIFSATFVGKDAVEIVPLFNLEKWNLILPIFVASLLIGLADEIFRLIAGVYCRLVMIGNLICGILQIALAAVVLKALPFWNPEFAQQLQGRAEVRSGDIPEFIEIIAKKWNADTVSNWMLAIVILITLTEIGTTVYKTLRYGVDKA